MSGDDCVVLIDLRHLIADLEYRGDTQREHAAREAMALIERLEAAAADKDAEIARLRAEVERLTPKLYPMTEIVTILNRAKHRKTDSWVMYRLAEEDYFNSTPVGFEVFANDDGDILETWEANLIAAAYIAQGLERDAKGGG